MLITTLYKYDNLNINDKNLFIDGVKIEIVSEVKYLGFIVDCHLNFNAIFNYIHKKYIYFPVYPKV